MLRGLRHHRPAADIDEDVAGAILPPLPPLPTLPAPDPAPAPDDTAPTPEPEMDIVIVVPPFRRLKPWLAALASAGIPYALQSSRQGCEILVPVDFALRARRELDAYDRLNRGWPPRRMALSETPSTYASAENISLAVAILVMGFHFYVGPFADSTATVHEGSADAAALVAGHWWRAVTALTLHADVSHVLANAVCLWWLGWHLGASVGGGLTWLAILVAGAWGNLGAAYWEKTAHDAVGASTATFAALAMLATIQVARNLFAMKELLSVWSRAWIPLLAGLALLGFLGTGPRTDLLGHLFGFLAGTMVGVLLIPVADRRLPGWVQFFAGALALATVIGAWYLVLSY